MVLESTLEVSQNRSDKLSAELDNMHQYPQCNCLIVSGIAIKHGESSANLKQSIEKNVLKDVGVSKKFFDYKFNKIHRIGAAGDDKQNIIVHFRSHQFPSKLYYAWKKNKNKKIGLKPSLTKRTALLCNITEKKKLLRITVIPSSSVILTSTAILKNHLVRKRTLNYLAKLAK